jgi:hypothetical protein
MDESLYLELFALGSTSDMSGFILAKFYRKRRKANQLKTIAGE